MLKLILYAMLLQSYSPTPEQYTCTAYCPCTQCNSGYTLSYHGTTLNKGIIAADPQVLPLNSILYIPGYGFGIVHDTGGAIKNNRLDLCYATHEKALQFGRQQKKAYMIVRGRQ